MTAEQTPHTTLPQDVKPSWLPLIRRMQAALADNQGFAILTIRVLVDSEGKPRMWAEPEVSKIEPKRCRDDIIMLLSQ